MGILLFGSWQVVGWQLSSWLLADAWESEKQAAGSSQARLRSWGGPRKAPFCFLDDRAVKLCVHTHAQSISQAQAASPRKLVYKYT